MPHQHDSPEAIAYMVADNKLTDSSDFDYGKLELNFEELELKGFNLELTGFNNTELKEVETKLEGKKEVEEDDFDPESVKESIVQPGDVWQLGNHKLMCRDSTNKEDVLNLLNDNKVDMVFTDPPYDFEDNSYFDSLKDVANEIFVMCSDKYLVKLANQYLDIFRYFFTVELSPPILINSKMPMTGHDLIAYFRTGKSTMNNLRDAFSTHIKLNKRKDGEHRHEKRLELPSNFIQHYTIKNGTVLDIFGGSGSTLMACEQLQRKCYMMELEPHNCDIIIARWEEFTGEHAIKEA
ncbi:MAG: DNA methylase [Methanobacterium sp. PtaB.Bin024]|nr:MAG: DNA methylase [Methanobacterium sp. PtaB.Bin024]